MVEAARRCFPAGLERNPVGVEKTSTPLPRVGPQTGQPWALFHNPLGVGVEMKRAGAVHDLADI